MNNSTEINKRYGPKPVKYKKPLMDAGVTVGAISNYLNLNYTYTSHILSGTYPLTPEIEWKLQQLCREIQES